MTTTPDPKGPKIGHRYTYIVEANPHDHGPKPGTYEGELISFEHQGSVQTDDGLFRGIALTLRCDDGTKITTNTFADYSYPLPSKETQAL